MDPSAPLMLSRVASDFPVLDMDTPCLQCGIALSSTAAVAIARRLTTVECPFVDTIDASLAHCAFASGVALVHVPFFNGPVAARSPFSDEASGADAAAAVAAVAWHGRRAAGDPLEVNL